MVLYPSEKRRGRKEAVIAESIRIGVPGFFSSRGVAIHRLSKYLDDPEQYDVGIRRVRHLTNDERILATHIMLMNVDSPYWPWKTIQIALAAYIPFLRKRLLNKQRFSCSGIIQKAFYDTVPWDQKRKVVFKNGVWSPIELTELASPADLAEGEIADWIYNEQR